MQLAAGSGSCSLVPALLCDDVRQEGFRSSTPTHPRPGHPNARGVPCFPNTPAVLHLFLPAGMRADDHHSLTTTPHDQAAHHHHHPEGAALSLVSAQAVCARRRILTQGCTLRPESSQCALSKCRMRTCPPRDISAQVLLTCPLDSPGQIARVRRNRTCIMRPRWRTARVTLFSLWSPCPRARFRRCLPRSR